jgi:xanthine/uracil/vitamin C permease (AzgA family)
MRTGAISFRISLSEFSGALADLGVLLPLMLALISVNKINPVSAFAGIGLAYLVSAFTYRLPVPVQPLKSLAATAIALGLSARVIAAGAWWMTVIFLILALIGAAQWLEKLFPKPVLRGIQLGLGLILIQTAIGLVTKPAAPWDSRLTVNGLQLPWTWMISIGAGLILVIMLRFRKEWAALGVVALAVLLALVYFGFPRPVFLPPSTIFLPGLPAPTDFLAALWLLVIPQVPLSLANSVYATSDAARQYFPGRADRVTPRRLFTTMGANNLFAALIGGVPVCHGCGGLTAHYRLGARTGGAPLMLGVIFLTIGVFGSTILLPLLKLIPLSALGVLLIYVGIQHTFLARDLRGLGEWVPALMVAAASVYTHSLAVGFALGAAAYFAVQGSAMLYRKLVQV